MQAVCKALDSLVADGKISSKTYNKQTVYVANQVVHILFFFMYVCMYPLWGGSDITSTMYVSFGQGSSLLWTHTLRPFCSRPIALTQEGSSLVNDVCECVRD